MITPSMMRKARMIEDNMALLDSYLGKKIESFKIRDEKLNLTGVREYDHDHSDAPDNKNIHLEINLSWIQQDVKLSQSLHLQEKNLDELIEMIVYSYRSLLSEIEMKLSRVTNSVQSLLTTIQKIDE